MPTSPSTNPVVSSFPLTNPVVSWTFLGLTVVFAVLAILVFTKVLFKKNQKTAKIAKIVTACLAGVSLCVGVLTSKFAAYMAETSD